MQTIVLLVHTGLRDADVLDFRARPKRQRAGKEGAIGVADALAQNCLRQEAKSKDHSRFVRR